MSATIVKESRPQRSAIVIGGSLGGLFAANMLHSAGWDVHVYERAEDDLASRGAGIGTHEELLEIMRRIGVTVDDSIGVHPKSRVCLDGSGNVVREMPLPRILSSWGRLYRALKDALPESRYHFSKALVSFKDTGERVTGVFSDGTRAGSDILIGADGMRSTVRALLMPEVEPRYAGYIAWRGVIGESSMPPELHAAIFDRNVFCLPEGEMMTAYALPGPDNDVRPGRRSYNFVWYHPVDGDEGLRDLCTDSAGRCHGTGIAPPLIRPDVIREMRAIAHAVLAPQIARVVDLTPQPFFQAIFDLESPRMAQRRVVLLGDAAFVARPHVGMGVTKAALDAECLADALSEAGDDIASGLAQYDAEQRLFGTRVVARARELGAHLEAQLSKPRHLRSPEELYQDPEVVMRDVGARLRDIPELYALVREAKARKQRAQANRSSPSGMSFVL